MVLKLQPLEERRGPLLVFLLLHKQFEAGMAVVQNCKSDRGKELIFVYEIEWRWIVTAFFCSHFSPVNANLTILLVLYNFPCNLGAFQPVSFVPYS